MGYLACFYSGFSEFANCLSPRKPMALGGFRADKKKLFNDFNKINKDLKPALKIVKNEQKKLSNSSIKINKNLSPALKAVKDE